MLMHSLMNLALVATWVGLLWPVNSAGQYVIEKAEAPGVKIPDTIVSMRSEVGQVTTKEGWRAEVVVQGMCVPGFSESMGTQTFFTLRSPTGGGGFSSGVDIDATASHKLLETLLADTTAAADSVFILRVTQGKLKIRAGTPSEGAGVNGPPFGRSEVAFTREEAGKIKSALTEAVKLHAWLQPRVAAFNKAGDR